MPRANLLAQNHTRSDAFRSRGDEFRVDILQAVADKQELIAMLLRAL
jgi:hypothetical protein